MFTNLFSRKHSSRSFAGKQPKSDRLNATKGYQNRYRLEQLEVRCTPAVSVMFSSGALSILGDVNDNDIDITFLPDMGTNYVIVEESNNIIFDGRPSDQNVAVSSITSISVDLLGGNDSADLVDVSSSNQFSSSLSNDITLSGGSGNDTLIGSSFSDILNGGADNDSLTGGSGGDEYVFGAGAQGTDDIVEADGAEGDQVDFSNSSVAVTFDLSSTSAQSWGNGTITLSDAVGVDEIVGSDFNDTFTGNSANNGINGGAGNDSIDGGGGDDFLNGNGGADTLRGGEGNDTVLSIFLGIDAAADSLFGDAGNDQLVGSDGSETLDGGAGNDTLVGLQGNDSLAGGGDDDVYAIDDGTGTDTIDEADAGGMDLLDFSPFGIGVNVDLTQSSQTVAPGSTLVFTNVANIENLRGSNFADTLTGNAASNLIEGRTGNDTMTGGAGNDFYVYEGQNLGRDTVVEAANLDTLDSFIFSDFTTGVTIDLSSTAQQSIGGGTRITLSDATGMEGVFGTAFADSITGNSRMNVINGAAGDDSLAGGANSDLYGYEGTDLGSDVITEAANADGDSLIFSDFGAGVTIDLSSNAAQMIGGNTTITLSNGTAIESVDGSAFADNITGNSRENFLKGNGDNDTLAGGSGNDVYEFEGTGLGSDTITEAANADSDTLDFSGLSGGGVPLNLGSTSPQTLPGVQITLSDATSIENAIGTSFGDAITGNTRNNLLDGGGGGDVLTGLAGNDTLLGGDAGDVLEGGAGDDSLNGGAGEDNYNFVGSTLGADTVTEVSAVDDDDTLIFTNFNHAVTIDISSASQQNIDSGGTNLQLTLTNPIEIDQVNGSAFADSITGNAMGNGLDGNAGADTIVGGGGDDRIDGGIGDDSLDGGTGDDQYVFSDAANQGSDSITEAADADSDSLLFDSSTSITIDLSSTSGQNWGSGTITLSSGTGIENVLGGSAGDTITGNARVNTLVGGGGDDSLSGAAGNDALVGLAGNDTLVGGQDSDALFGGADDDSLAGGTGDDFYFFEAEPQGSDTVDETGGGSAIETDFLSFSDADVAVTIDLSSTSAQSWGDGTITLTSATSIEGVIGSAFNDSITGNSRDNVLGGGFGNDTISGGDGRDILSGDDGFDSLTGGNGSDLLNAGSIELTTVVDLFDIFTALDAILGAWVAGDNSLANYEDRIENITGAVGAPNPINDDYQLIVGSSLIDDSDSDTLVGNSELDWFIADNGEDTLSDQAVDEVLTDIGV